MKELQKTIAFVMASILAIQLGILANPVDAQMTPQDTRSQDLPALENTDANNTEQMQRGIALTGEYIDRTAEQRAEQQDLGRLNAYKKDQVAQPGPYASLPIVDQALQRKIQLLDDQEQQPPLRVIVHLSFLPHAQVLNDVLMAHDQEIKELETDRLGLLKTLKQHRKIDTVRDSENYPAMRYMTKAQRAALQNISERNERLSTTIKNETAQQLRPLIVDSQQPIKEAITRLGGTVEFGTIAGNLIIALLPPNAIESLAKESGIIRIVEDSMMQGYLPVADNSTMVDPADTSLLGLWDNGHTGSEYDPAIIDSGLDKSNPLMDNSSSAPMRTNFETWYLSAASGSIDWNDMFTADDLQGHGTHVAGIVGSQGSSFYLSHLGMAQGVEKLVNLKAGWRNTAGTTSMFWSDKYNVVDQALYNSNSLLPPNTFFDDVDGMNLSYGGGTALDDTDGGRFWDSVISTYLDLPVTIAAGNTGPTNTVFSDPAVSWNAIAVANFDDNNTDTRTDDIINASSTRGPTANGRRKPDIAAPGTDISAPNHQWETELDVIEKTGTSMAAPMVLGVAMDLMDAGLFDELSIKAVLLNTAQKNLASANFESDADGWSPAYGWGIMNAYAAYTHRFDVFPDSVAPSGNSGDFQLYRGVMRDEGSIGEGRDRATLAWNRSATYLTASPPTNYYTLSDLDLGLYEESNNNLIDFDTDIDDNVHQVRVNSGTLATDVVINVLAYSTVFANGLSVQPYALATEEDFERVDFPVTFQGFGVWPFEVEPNEIFEIEFWIANNSQLPSHDNEFDLQLPSGFTLISGSDIQNVGSIASGADTNIVSYTIQAGPVVQTGENISVAHRHASYGEFYGDHNWVMGLDVLVDNTAPNPDPMSYEELPINVSTSQIDAVAAFATDLHDPVQYYHEHMGSPTGGTGGTNSSWQINRGFSDVGLQANDEYCYRVLARDNATAPNSTMPSATACTYTSQSVQPAPTVTTVSTSTIGVTATVTPNNLALDGSGLKIDNITTGTSGGWQQTVNPVVFSGLNAARPYEFVIHVRNGDGDISPPSSIAEGVTLANPPAANFLAAISTTQIEAAVNPNGNIAAEYLIQNITAGTESGWRPGTTWLSEGLTCGTVYSFQAKARNSNGIETIFVPLGSQTTHACDIDTDNDGIVDAIDNCTLKSNPGQQDSNGDGIGNICDQDINNDCFVNFLDYGLMVNTGVLFSMPGDAGWNPDIDFNSDNIYNFLDVGQFGAPNVLFNPPGPSANACLPAL